MKLENLFGGDGDLGKYFGGLSDWILVHFILSFKILRNTLSEALAHGNELEDVDAA